VIWGICTVTFLLVHIMPGDPASIYFGVRPTAEQIAVAKAKLGLDKPLHIQYLRYLINLVHGDFGISARTHQPVLKDIVRYAPASLELIGVTLIFIIIIGMPLGVIAAQRKDSLIDVTLRSVSLAGVTMPSFWLGILLQLFFFRLLGVLPIGGRISTAVQLSSPIKSITGFYLLDSLLTGNIPAFKSAVLHIILPAITLGAFSIGLLMRVTRASILEEFRKDYVVTARAAGVSELKIAFRYALKNSAGPIISLLGLLSAWFLTGTFFVEIIFFWPGLGTYSVKSLLSADYSAILALTFLIAVAYSFVNLFVDVIQAFIDPRIRY